MAVEKILNTRILNKIDTLENWNASTLPIKKGEICIATVAATAGTGLTEPVVMIKIGEDGVKTFKDLPWNLYAKASDVLAACKTESGLTAFVNNVIASSGLATDSAMTALSGRVTAAEGKITTAEGNITALQGLVGDTKVSLQIQNAIDALKLSETYAAKVHTHTKADITDFAHTHTMTEVTGLTDAIADAKKAGTDANTALNTYKATNDAAVQANADAIVAINNETTGILAQAKTYADGKDAAIAAAKKAGDDAQADVDALEAKVGTVPADKTVVQMIADAQKDATYDDTALAARVTTAENDIDALEAKVGDNKVSVQIDNAIAALNLATTYEAKGAAAAVKTAVIGTASDTAAADTIKGAKKYADGLNTAMDTRVDALETAIGEGGSVGAQIDAKIQKLDVADTAVTGQYVSAVSETDGKITVTRAALPDYTETYDAKGAAAQALADAKTYADGLNTAMDTRMDTAEGKLTTLIGTDTGKSVRKIANEELAAQLIPDGAKESLDTLQEIAAWIQAHPDDASAMSADIAELQGLVGDENVSTRIDNAINGLKNNEIKAATDRITTLEGKSHEHANKSELDKIADGDKAKWDTAAGKAHTHANATELAKFANGDKAKLDTAVQTVTAGTGLTATKTGTDVAVGFDDTVTFVFDCGDSTTV